jgi:heme-degrading monooxygenase HmoA
MTTPTILRRWSGAVRTPDVEGYRQYFLESGAPGYANSPGNLGYQLLFRDRNDGTSEVSTLSWWDSLDAIRAFTGDEPERAIYYPKDDRFLIERSARVEHHQIAVDS